MTTDPATGNLALVTGATGVLGSLLVRHLCESGWRVRALTRRSSSAPSPAEPVAADLLDTNALRQALNGVETVFHLAALVERRDRRFADSDFTRINVEGTASLVRAAREAGVGRVVYFSSAAVYGPTIGPAATERSVPAPTSRYARSKLEGEKVALGEMPTAVLRLAAVYGPHVEGRYLQLARLHRYGWLQLTGRNVRTLVFERDLVDAATMAARHPAAVGRVYNVTDGAVHSLESITNAIRTALGCSYPAIRMSVQGLESVARRAERFAVVVPRLALFDALRKLAENSAVDGSAIGRDLGFAARWTLERGWHETMTAWKSRGLL